MKHIEDEVTERLKSCPFCGRQPKCVRIGFEGSNMKKVVCPCGAVTQRNLSAEHGLEIWNNRYNPNPEE